MPKTNAQIPVDARTYLEDTIRCECYPEDDIDQVALVLNAAFRCRSFTSLWSFIECGPSADDKSMLSIQMVIDGQPRVYKMSLNDIADIARSR